jgi:hypothetical protein
MVSFSHSVLLVAVITNGVWSFSPQIHGLVSQHISSTPSLQPERRVVPRTNSIIYGEGNGSGYQGEEKMISNVGILTTPPQSEEYDNTAALVAHPNEGNDQSSPPPISLWMSRTILLLVAIVWGTNFATVKYLETLCFHPPCNHPPSEFALARFGVAGLASLPFLIRQPSPVILAGLECGLWIAVGYFTQGT